MGPDEYWANLKIKALSLFPKWHDSDGQVDASSSSGNKDRK
jgi:hypothetical protein